MSTSKRAQNSDRPPLSREQVVQAALTMIDTGGLNALTMRKLADVLGVYPTSLYWHAGSKAQLLALVYREVVSDIDIPPVTSLRWDDWIVALGRNSRAALGQHPDLAANFTSHIQVSNASLELTDSVILVLEGAGFRDAQLLNAYNTVIGTIFGWISAEFAAAGADAAENWADEFQAELRSPEVAERYDGIHRNLALFANNGWMIRWESGSERPMRKQFEAMLTYVVSGLRAALD